MQHSLIVFVWNSATVTAVKEILPTLGAALDSKILHQSMI